MLVDMSDQKTHKSTPYQDDREQPADALSFLDEATARSNTKRFNLRS